MRASLHLREYKSRSMR